MMKRIDLLLPVLAIFLLAGSCKTTKDCCTDYNDYKKQYNTCYSDLMQTKTKYQDMQLNYLTLVQLYDSVTGTNDSNLIACITELDQLKDDYALLDTSFSILAHMYDSVLKIPPDTVVWMPQCTLCYKDTVNINGIQYYVGYDGRHYKIYMDPEDQLRLVYFHDTTVIRVKDSIVSPPEVCLLIVEAAGSICKDDWPILNIEINGQPFKDLKIGKTGYNQYWMYPYKHEFDVDSIRITFGNDCYVEGVEDRNCYVKSVMINHHEYLLKDNTILSGYIWWKDEDPHTVIMGSNGSILIKSYKTNGQYY